MDPEGVDGDAALGNNELKEASDDDAKYTLERVQVDIVLAKSLKDNS